MGSMNDLDFQFDSDLIVIMTHDSRSHDTFHITDTDTYHVVSLITYFIIYI